MTDPTAKQTPHKDSMENIYAWTNAQSGTKNLLITLMLNYAFNHAVVVFHDRTANVMKFKFNDGTLLTIVRDEITITQDDAATL